MRVALYLRVSTEDQAREGYSLAAQEHTLREWCIRNGHDISGIYIDAGLSAKDIVHRPQMRRMMQDAQTGAFDAILVWALSRFTRSMLDLCSTLDTLAACGVSLISYSEAFDVSTPTGRAMAGVVGVFAQLERELTSERVKAAAAERARQGKRTTNEVLGYDLDGPDGLVINPVEAERVRYIFEIYLQRKSLTEVAELCRLKGYTGKRGRVQTPESVRIILTRPIYCGYNQFKGRLYKGNHQPIVPKETYNKVQRLIIRQGETRGRPLKNKLKIID